MINHIGEVVDIDKEEDLRYIRGSAGVFGILTHVTLKLVRIRNIRFRGEMADFGSPSDFNAGNATAFTSIENDLQAFFKRNLFGANVAEVGSSMPTQLFAYALCVLILIEILHPAYFINEVLTPHFACSRVLGTFSQAQQYFFDLWSCKVLSLQWWYDETKDGKPDVDKRSVFSDNGGVEVIGGVPKNVSLMESFADKMDLNHRAVKLGSAFVSKFVMCVHFLDSNICYEISSAFVLQFAISRYLIKFAAYLNMKTDGDLFWVVISYSNPLNRPP
jgi:hypothetical protein